MFPKNVFNEHFYICGGQLSQDWLAKLDSWFLCVCGVCPVVSMCEGSLTEPEARLAASHPHQSSVSVFPQGWGAGAIGTPRASDLHAGDSITDPNAWAASALTNWATSPTPSLLISKFRN